MNLTNQLTLTATLSLFKVLIPELSEKCGKTIKMYLKTLAVLAKFANESIVKTVINKEIPVKRLIIAIFVKPDDGIVNARDIM